MVDINNLISAVTAKTGLSVEEVQLKIKNKQRELSGLVSEEGAAYIVANELGVKTRNRIIENNLKITEIMPEMKSVTLLGKVKNIIGPREFTSKKGYKGKVVNLELVDNTGAIRVVLWNMSDIEKIEKGEVKVGDIIQVKNGYVRPSFKEGHEIHLGNRGMLIIDPEEVNANDFPSVVSRLIKIDEIKPEQQVSVIGRVTHSFGINEFDKNGRKGKVANVILNDGTGTIRLVLWNEQAELVNDLQVGDILQVDNGFAKEGLRGIEVQANWATKIYKNPVGIELPSLEEIGVINSSDTGIPMLGKSQRIKIADLKDGDSYKELRGVIVDIYGEEFVHDMCPNCNKKIKNKTCEKCGSVEPIKLAVVNALIDDGSGTIRASFFRENAETLFGMKTQEIAIQKEKVDKRLQELLGKEIIIEGRVKINDFSNNLEFNVFKLMEFDPKNEAENLIKELETTKT